MICKRDVRELESRLEVLVMHLLKWPYQPERRERGRRWRSTIIEQRGRLQRLLAQSPSLHPQIPILVAEGYTRTRQRTLVETGLTESVIPPTCPWSTGQSLDDAFWPEEALRRQG